MGLLWGTLKAIVLFFSVIIAALVVIGGTKISGAIAFAVHLSSRAERFAEARSRGTAAMKQGHVTLFKGSGYDRAIDLAPLLRNLVAAARSLGSGALRAPPLGMTNAKSCFAGGPLRAM